AESEVTADQFKCAFPDIDENLRNQRWDGFQKSGWKPANNEEAACLLAHVSQETDSLKTLEEYCGQDGTCKDNYQTCDWNGAPAAVPGHYYWGRGALQISYPCNYKGAGDALQVDLLNNPEQVATNQALAWKVGVWFYTDKQMS
ncbi:unnamed protein product, partial [Didymodactylos carnosus]